MEGAAAWRRRERRARGVTPPTRELACGSQPEGARIGLLQAVQTPKDRNKPTPLLSSTLSSDGAAAALLLLRPVRPDVDGLPLPPLSRLLVSDENSGTSSSLPLATLTRLLLQKARRPARCAMRGAAAGETRLLLLELQRRPAASSRPACVMA